MMKTKLYRTVACSDRLPKESIMREVLTNEGLLKFQDGKWWLWWQGGDYTEVKPKWWLEEIELPSEEDVHKESFTYYGNTPGTRSLNIFKHGASFILNKLKGE